ncbi:glycosyltransferase [candidate division KSB1 bacterium]
MFISIILPALNESKKIREDIEAAAEFIEKNDFQGEIIVVDDGSSDDTADAARTAEIPKDISLQIIRYKTHRGKGYAVRAGVISAKGEYVMFADSGLCVPYDYVLTAIKILQDENYDIAHGSRKLKDSKIVRQQPLIRRIIAKIFRWIFIHWLNVPRELTDTQCGFKVYKGDIVRKLYTQCVTDGFLFDIEIILRAQKQNIRIIEFPIEWKIDPDSRLSVKRNSFDVLRELIALKRLLSKL